MPGTAYMLAPSTAMPCSAGDPLRDFAAPESALAEGVVEPSIVPLPEREPVTGLVSDRHDPFVGCSAVEPDPAAIRTGDDQKEVEACAFTPYFEGFARSVELEHGGSV